MSMRSTRGNFGAIYMRHYENAWARRSGRRNNRSLFVLFELGLSLRRLVCCRHGRGDASHAANLSLVELFSRSLHVLYSCTLHIGWVPRRKRFKWKKKNANFFSAVSWFFRCTGDVWHGSAISGTDNTGKYCLRKIRRQGPSHRSNTNDNVCLVSATLTTVMRFCSWIFLSFPSEVDDVFLKMKSLKMYRCSSNGCIVGDPKVYTRI